MNFMTFRGSAPWTIVGPLCALCLGCCCVPLTWASNTTAHDTIWAHVEVRLISPLPPLGSDEANELSIGQQVVESSGAVLGLFRLIDKDRRVRSGSVGVAAFDLLLSPRGESQKAIEPQWVLRRRQLARERDCRSNAGSVPDHRSEAEGVVIRLTPIDHVRIAENALRARVHVAHVIAGGAADENRCPDIATRLVPKALESDVVITPAGVDVSLPVAEGNGTQDVRLRLILTFLDKVSAVVGHVERLGYGPSAAPSIAKNRGAHLVTVTHKLNDTGIFTFSGASEKGLLAEPDDLPGQDASHGRDAAARNGRLEKIGDGRHGFDFTKIDNSGRDLPNTAKLGDEAGDWGCTRDNVTSLTWEVKAVTPGHFRYFENKYRVPVDDRAPNEVKSIDTEARVQCGATSVCDGRELVNQVNSAGLCGARDWRLPTIKELESIVDYGRAPNTAIDPVFFPNTEGSYLSSTRKLSLFGTAQRWWYVFFGNGTVSSQADLNPIYIRLVRGTR